MLKELPDKNWKKNQKNLLLGIKFLSTNCFVTSHYLRKTLSESYIHSIVNVFLYLTGYAVSKCFLQYFRHLVLIFASLCFMYF